MYYHTNMVIINQNVYIAFRNMTNNGYILQLDNIKITTLIKIKEPLILLKIIQPKR